MGRKPLDLTGLKVGKLTVLEPAYRDGHKRVIWKCQCECGNITYVRGDYLYKGQTKSCGCYSKRGRRERSEEERQHMREVNSRSLTDRSLCWNCIRSAAPESLQCIWDKTRAEKMVDGAIGKVVGKVPGAGGSRKLAGEDVIMIESCPLFLSMDEPENMALLRAERDKVQAVMRKDMEERALATSCTARVQY